MFQLVDTSNYHIHASRYANGNLALRILAADGEPVAEITIDRPLEILRPAEFIAKNYGENSALFLALIHDHYFAYTGKFTLVGRKFCPICVIGAEMMPILQ